MDFGDIDFSQLNMGGGGPGDFDADVPEGEDDDSDTEEEIEDENHAHSEPQAANRALDTDTMQPRDVTRIFVCHVLQYLEISP
ncbi:hypothetical protein RND71_005081 [Anisodus tanguticus]|uniref:Uncharacterized protein n=1 Tax=Anisodus tanguticus TaxID=243964 RepID=A0AAE1SR68_9SOLA|nr:hypothetical protein RND71_005081 [Anisodus tanguticus]